MALFNKKKNQVAAKPQQSVQSVEKVSQNNLSKDEQEYARAVKMFAVATEQSKSQFVPRIKSV